jgi:hypothetical protein
MRTFEVLLKKCLPREKRTAMAEIDFAAQPGTLASVSPDVEAFFDTASRLENSLGLSVASLEAPESWHSYQVMQTVIRTDSGTTRME